MLRRRLKKALFRRLGRFPYYGETVYFPRKSFLFGLACDQGVYEHANVRLLLAVVEPGTYFFDVGANIGLMALPVLRTVGDSRVVSFEPSPGTAPYLRRTVERSSFESRWQVVEKAVGAKSGWVDFHVMREGMGAFDGLFDTGRGASSSDLVRVQMSTIDDEWMTLGRPRVSAIKVDVEGAELEVLLGAAACLASQRPAVLLEWNPPNSAAAGRRPGDLLSAAEHVGYSVYCAPSMVPIANETDLAAQMLVSESFLLIPKRVSGCR